MRQYILQDHAINWSGLCIAFNFAIFYFLILFLFYAIIILPSLGYVRNRATSTCFSIFLKEFCLYDWFVLQFIHKVCVDVTGKLSTVWRFLINFISKLEPWKFFGRWSVFINRFCIHYFNDLLFLLLPSKLMFLKRIQVSKHIQDSRNQHFFSRSFDVYFFKIFFSQWKIP